ncbi:alpha/beta hydrolase family protein [Streptomyces sp. SS7]|uniref:alpha/beta hydrolase n=1 Tax=Streptomyces sp. SS7 TaxID=3108485 RepID=UPI0030EE1A54
MSFTVTSWSSPASGVVRCFASVLAVVASLVAAVVPAHAHGPGNAPRAADGDASIASVKQIDERTQDIMVHSPAMHSSIPVRVILPKNWNSEKEAKFPVLYMLHGGDDNYTSWTRETDVEELARKSDVLVVMPDGGKFGYYSDWHAGTHNWETFHTKELVRLMEKEYRASSARAIMGLSMGGFGALNYAGRHRGMFRYVAAMSSYVDLNEPSVRLTLQLGSQRDGIDIKDVWGDPVRDFGVWQDHNPAAMTRAFRGTRVHLSTGDGTVGPLDAGRPLDVLLVGSVAETVLPEQTRRFASALRSAGVTTTTHIYRPGTHSWPYWQRELHAVWPTVTRVLDQ